MTGPQMTAWLRALAWIAIVVLGIFVLVRIPLTLVVFSLAGGICYLLYPCVLALHVSRPMGHRISWPASVATVFVILPLVFGAVVVVAIPPISEQVVGIRDNLPSMVDRVQQNVIYWQTRFDKLRLPAPVRQHLQNIISNSVNSMAEGLARFFGQLANAIFNTFTWLLFLVVAMIISHMMLLNLPAMRLHFYASIPSNYRSEIGELLHDIHVALGGFIKGTAIMSVCVGAAVGLSLGCLHVLWWLGVPGVLPYQYSLLVGVVTVFCYPVPLLGMAALCLVSGLLAYFEPGGTVMYACTVILFVLWAFNGVDRVLGPRVMGKAMGVSPLFVMFAAFAGAELMGFWGMILGVPMAAALKILFRYVRARFLSPQRGELGMLALVSALDSLTSSHLAAAVEPDDVVEQKTPQSLMVETAVVSEHVAEEQGSAV
jgi:predicted PurR-regulated permease PerM